MAPGQRCLLGQQSEGCCLQVPEQRGVPGARKEGERGRKSESVAADTTEDGPEGRGQEQGARRGIQKSMARARSTWGQRGPFSSDPASPAARRPQGSWRSPWFGTQSLPTGDVVPAHPSLFLPSNTGCPFPSAGDCFCTGCSHCLGWPSLRTPIRHHLPCDSLATLGQFSRPQP